VWCWIGWHLWRNAELGRRIGNFDRVTCIDVCARCKAQRVRVLAILRLQP
jgi:hypothetical protein